MALVDQVVLDNIGVLVLNDPKRRNALSEDLAGELLAGLDAFRERRIPVVIMRATEGSKVWCAGHNVQEMPRSRRDPLGYEDPMERLLRSVQEYPGPVIAMVQGSVWGGGCDLIMCCDMIIGDETASFAITPAKLGVPYNISGILHFLGRMHQNIAREMFYTADPITAERAERVGILNHLVPSGELFEFTLQIARRIASRSPLAVQVIKEQFRILAGAHPVVPEMFERIQGLRRRVYDSRDYEEGISSFIEKRAPVFKGE